MSFSSVPKSELQAVIWALRDHSSIPIHPFSDSTSVCSVMHRMETSTIHTSQEDLVHLLHTLRFAIESHPVPYFTGHLCSPSQLTGPLTEGNAAIDRLLATILDTPSDAIQQAYASYATF